MRIRLLSGNQTGQIVDVPGASILLSNGLAELVPDEVVVTLAAPEPEAEGGDLSDQNDPAAEESQAEPVPLRRRPVKKPAASHGKRR